MKSPLLLNKFKILSSFGPGLGYLIGRSAWASMDLRVFGAENLDQAYRQRGQIICAFWHNRTFLLPFIYCYEMRLKHLAAMVSRSRDGQFLADFLERFGFQTIRGSTTSGGTKTFIQAVRVARQGYDVAIAPDGPRGPCYQVQPGIIKLAQMTSLPIVPVSYQASIRREFHSWDRFIAPAPFSRIAFEVAPAINVPRRATRQELDHAKQRLQDQLMQLNISTSLRLKQSGKPGAILAQSTGYRKD